MCLESGEQQNAAKVEMGNWRFHSLPNVLYLPIAHSTNNTILMNSTLFPPQSRAIPSKLTFRPSYTSNQHTKPHLPPFLFLRSFTSLHLIPQPNSYARAAPFEVAFFFSLTIKRPQQSHTDRSPSTSWQPPFSPFSSS